MNTMKKISLAYIVKNEEDNIKKSILSCKDVVDEIIVVDTGSVDNTVKIAKELGAQVEHFEWCNDFAKARNYAISKCSGDYIIFLDADEYFSPALTKKDGDKLQAYVADNSNAYGFLQEDIDKKTKKIHHRVFLVRMFKNCEYLKYNGEIHEALGRTDGEELVANIIRDFKIIHTGYSAEISQSKAERNLALLENLEDKRPIDYFYLARENLSMNKPEACMENVDLFFKQEGVNQIIETTTMVYDIYFIAIKAMKMLPEKYDNKDIYNWLKTIKKILPDLPKTYFYLGMYYMDFDFRKAEKYFLEALLKEKEIMEHGSLKLDDFENYKGEIYYYLAKIEFFKKNRQNAINKAGVACVYDNKNPKYFGLLLTLLNHQRTQGIINKNISFIANLFKPNDKEDYAFIIRGLATTDLLEEFIYFSMLAVQNFDITTEDNCSDIYFAELISTNNPDEVLEKTIMNNSNKGNFIKLCSMIYKKATQGDLGKWQEYLNKMPLEYRQTYNMLINLNKPKNITDEFKVLLRNTFLQMTFLGFAGITTDFLEILKNIYGYDKNMSTILNVWSNNGDPSVYTQIISFIYSTKEKEIIDTTAYANDTLYFLYMTEEYDSLIDQAWIFMEKGYALPMNYIRGAKPSKSYVKKQRELCSAELV